MKSIERLYKSSDIAANSDELLAMLERWGHNVEHLKSEKPKLVARNEYYRIRVARIRANMTPEQKTKYLARKQFLRKRWIANMTPAQRVAYNQLTAASFRRRYYLKLEQSREYNRLKHRRLRANMTKEKRTKYQMYNRQCSAKWRANMTEADRIKWREYSRVYMAKRRATMSEAERLRVREQDRIRAARKKAEKLLALRCDVAPVTEQTAPLTAELVNA